MWQQELLWFFALFHQEFRKNNPIAFEVLMVLAIAHLFGFYNPKQLADFLHVPHQKFSAELKDWSVYHVKKMMNFSQGSLRGAEIWHIWKQHHVIECFWKIMKSIFQMRSMQLQGDGLYTALLIKVFAYLLALRLQAQGVFPKLTITQIMRTLRREEDLREFLTTHFHDAFSIT